MNGATASLNTLLLLTPEFWMVGAIVLASLWNLFVPKAKSLTPIWCLIGLGMAFVSLINQFPQPITYLFHGLYTVDKMTVGCGLLTCLIGVIVVLMTIGYEKHFGNYRGEFYALLMTALLAVMLLAGTTDLIMLFVALETLSVCCVLLSGVFKRDRKSNEAALKYLLSTAASTATLLYGLSFIYGITGSTSFATIHTLLAPFSQTPSLLSTFIIILLLSGIGFKLSTIPFHMWTPDVYEGAPTPVTAFLSIGSKLGGFVIAIRILLYAYGTASATWVPILAILAIASMIGGNFIALTQKSFKRMLAYSSIAHMGYILMGVVANSSAGLSASFYYLVVYGLMNLGAFAGAILFSNETGSDLIDDYAGLFRRRPWLALGIAICLLNLAGLPIPPAGFFAKVFVFWSAVQMQTTLGWSMVIAALITSVPAIYYYCRVVIKMVVREPSSAVAAMNEERPRSADPQFYPIAALSICIAGIALAAVIVTPFMNYAVQTMVPISAPGILEPLSLDQR